MSKTVSFKWKELAPSMVVVQDSDENIGLLTESEWMEAMDRVADALIKAIPNPQKEA